MRLRLAAAALPVAALLALPGAAWAIACPQVPLQERVAEADAAFVGRLKGIRTDAEGRHVYRFDVRQRVKGPVAGLVEVSSVEPLTDAKDHPLVLQTVVGVMAGLDGARLTTSSCLLTDPAALLAEADRPKGTIIKVAIGSLILLGVLLWAIVRRRHGTRPELPGAPRSAGE